MKKIVFFMLTAFVSFKGLTQKTIRDANVEARNVSGFHAIEVSGGIHLYLSNGDEAVAVSASDKDYSDRIKTEVKDGVLKIYYDWKKGMKFNVKGTSLKAYVSFKTLDRLSASGGSDVKMEGIIQSGTLKIRVSGGADLRAKVDVGNLTLDQSGGADVDLTGKVTDLNIQANGGSDFSGYDLESDNCIIRASGGSDVRITVNKEFYAEASGAADINWKGKATVKGSRASGAGSVSHRS
jgi:hypothetical protein